MDPAPDDGARLQQRNLLELSAVRRRVQNEPKPGPANQKQNIFKMSTGPDFKPLWLAQDPLGQVWVGDARKLVVVFDSNFQRVHIKGLERLLSFYPQGIAFGPKGELAVVNYNENRIEIVRDIPAAEAEQRAGEKSPPTEKKR